MPQRSIVIYVNIRISKLILCETTVMFICSSYIMCFISYVLKIGHLRFEMVQSYKYVHVVCM